MFYRDDLGLHQPVTFIAHNGLDGVMLGHGVGRAPTADNLLVFYLPDLAEWRAAVRRMTTAGFAPVLAYNPYWDQPGHP